MRRAIAMLGAVLLAAALTVGSGANFNASSANANNVIAAGIVAVNNPSAGSAALTVTGLAPGHSGTGSLDLSNSGDIAADWSLTASKLVDAPTSPALSAKLALLVEDLGDPACASSCPAVATVYSGTLKAFSTVALGTWAPGAKHRIRFTVTMPDGGDDGSDNVYQGARSTLDLTWTAVGAKTDTTTTGTTTTATTTATTPTTTTPTTTTPTTTTATTTTP